VCERMLARLVAATFFLLEDWYRRLRFRRAIAVRVKTAECLWPEMYWVPALLGDGHGAAAAASTASSPGLVSLLLLVFSVLGVALGLGFSKCFPSASLWDSSWGSFYDQMAANECLKKSE
jgi:hypothetical protein